MCGIAGYLGSENISKKKIFGTLDLMKQRGPDNIDYVHKKLKKKNLYLLHSRLSIIDLDKRSNQPYEYKNLIMVFNGEIYNYLELKKDLLRNNYNFKTTSDTEVLLKYFHYKGLKSFNDFDGMWSLAIFDKVKNKLILSKDRFGEKPLFYLKDKTGIYFGSETKFIESIYKKKLNINFEKCKQFLNYGYNSVFTNSETFIENILNFPNASVFQINLSNKVKKNKYWDIKKINKNKNNKSIKKTIDQIRKKLINSTKIRTRSDVDLGSFLSSGTDSNSIVSIQKKKLKQNFNTFSIFDKKSKRDESFLIKKILKKNNYKNISIDASEIDIVESLKKSIKYHNAPIFTLNSLIQSHLFKKIKSKKIKVMLSGIGADEIFAGYYDHFLYHLRDQKNKKEYNKNLKFYNKFINKKIKNKKIKEILNSKKLLFSRVSLTDSYQSLIKSKISIPKNIKKYSGKSNLQTALICQLDENLSPALYLEDLNSMMHSIEVRSPFLSKDLVEEIFSINSNNLIKTGFSKNILREAMVGIVSKSILKNRYKLGFYINIFNNKKFKNFAYLSYLLKKNSATLELLFKFKKLNNFLSKIYEKKMFTNENAKFIFRILNIILFIKFKKFK